jgi:CRP/FNR family transcriptional regulator, cyclic AMP receptor protein
VKYHRGEIIFRQGETGNLFRLHTGLLKVVWLREDGTPFLFNILTPGEVFPHHSLLSPKPCQGTAIALVTSEVERIPAAAWYKSLEENPYQYREAALLLQKTLRKIQERISMVTAHKEDRIEGLRQWLARYFPDHPIEEMLTQEEMGQLLGISRETVNRLLNGKRR